ncbi:MAG: NAD(P)-binding domain-containing protein [Acidimicrobiales bacterium]
MAGVSASVSVAEAGQLTVMVGGAAGALERARPVLDAVARRVFHLGELGRARP